MPACAEIDKCVKIHRIIHCSKNSPPPPPPSRGLLAAASGEDKGGANFPRRGGHDGTRSGSSLTGGGAPPAALSRHVGGVAGRRFALTGGWIRQEHTSKRITTGGLNSLVHGPKKNHYADGSQKKERISSRTSPQYSQIPIGVERRRGEQLEEFKGWKSCKIPCASFINPHFPRPTTFSSPSLSCIGRLAASLAVIKIKSGWLERWDVMLRPREPLEYTPTFNALSLFPLHAMYEEKKMPEIMIFWGGIVQHEGEGGAVWGACPGEGRGVEDTPPHPREGRGGWSQGGAPTPPAQAWRHPRSWRVWRVCGVPGGSAGPRNPPVPTSHHTTTLPPPPLSVAFQGARGHRPPQGAKPRSAERRKRQRGERGRWRIAGAAAAGFCRDEGGGGRCTVQSDWGALVPPAVGLPQKKQGAMVEAREGVMVGPTPPPLAWVLGGGWSGGTPHLLGLFWVPTKPCAAGGGGGHAFGSSGSDAARNPGDPPPPGLLVQDPVSSPSPPPPGSLGGGECHGPGGGAPRPPLPSGPGHSGGSFGHLGHNGIWDPSTTRRPWP